MLLLRKLGEPDDTLQVGALTRTGCVPWLLKRRGERGGVIATTQLAGYPDASLQVLCWCVWYLPGPHNLLQSMRSGVADLVPDADLAPDVDLALGSDPLPAEVLAEAHHAGRFHVLCRARC